MGRDGAEGARAIHEHGGQVVAHDPQTAEFSSMPLAAVAALSRDKVEVVPLDRIAAVLPRLIQQAMPA